MLKIRKYPKRSPYWIIRGTVKGQPIFESSGTIDRREAEEFRRKREASLYEQIALGTLRPTVIPPFLEGVRRRTHPEDCTSICRLSF